MKTSRKFTFLLFALLIGASAHAQLGTLFKNNEEKGDAFFEEFSYVEAIEEYKIAFEKTPTNPIVLKIAESYRKLNDPAQSSAWYVKAVLGEIKEPEAYLHYADALSSLERYDEAKEWYHKYSTLVPDDIRPKQKIRAIDNLKKFRDRSTEITVNRATFNSEAADFSPEFYENDQIVFVSSRASGAAFANVFNWDNSEYLNLFVTDKKNKGKLFQSGINSKYHEGPLSIYGNNQKMIFTRNDYLNNSLGADEEGTTKLKLYNASRGKDGAWNKPEEFKYNNAEYSVGHPAVIEDGSLLIFASDMPGGVGGTDLYVSEWMNDQWSAPINLGEAVNTKGNELFPYINNERQLFFSSDGHGGFGGLDIFGIDLDTKDDKSSLVNLGKPINSSFDDFSLIIEGDYGFFSSNREGGKNNDDIYSFKTQVPLVQTYSLKVSVTDNATASPIGDAALLIRDTTGMIVKQVITNAEGEVAFTVEPYDRYSVEVVKAEYVKDSIIVNIEGDNVMLVRPIKLTKKDTVPTQQEPDTIYMHQGKDGTFAVSQTIYFDFRKSRLPSEAQKTLLDVISILKKNRTTAVAINAHTDSRGEDEFNQNLSLKRANATVKFLTSHGINVKRIVAEGSGEKFLINHCKDSVECTEEEHQVNRRTELRIFEK
jgi:outer membrane protein OmpA-like peptidoglycan-associated protein